MSQKAWLNAYTRGSKALQQRLAKIHANNPEFQDFVKKHGFGGNLSVKQSGIQKKSSVSTVKPVTQPSPETNKKMDREALIKAAAEKIKDRRAAAANRVAFGGELGGGFQMPMSGFRTYREDVNMDESKANRERVSSYDSAVTTSLAPLKTKPKKTILGKLKSYYRNSYKFQKKDVVTENENMKESKPPFTPNKPTDNLGVVKGKNDPNYSRVRHLARLELKKQLERNRINRTIDYIKNPRYSVLDKNTIKKTLQNTDESIIGGLVGLAVGAAGAIGAAKNTPLQGKDATVKNYLKNFGKGMVGIGLKKKKTNKAKEVKESLDGTSPRVYGFENFKKMAHDWAFSNDHHNGGRPLLHQKTIETDKVIHQTLSIGHHPVSGNPYVIGVFNHIGGPNSEEGHGTHHHHTQGLELDEEVVNEVSKELAKRYVIAAVKDINHSSREAEGARTAAYADYMNKKAVKRSNAIAKNTKAMRAYKDHVFGKDIYKEDSHDAEGASSRVSKSKRLRKKLHELNTGTLASYVSKAIAHRKAAQRNQDIRRKEGIDNGKLGEIITRRSKGIKTAVGKIAKAYEESEVNEVSAPGKEAWIKANKQRFIAKYGKEKGLRVLYAKAWKDAKNESSMNETHLHETLPVSSVSKYKKAAEKAISLTKKAKSNKHIDTKPKLDLPDKGTSTSIEDSRDESNGKL